MLFRSADIVRQLTHAAAQQGLTPIDDDALLDEVTALVERPHVLLCQFEAEFLAVPRSRPQTSRYVYRRHVRWLGSASHGV